MSTVTKPTSVSIRKGNLKHDALTGQYVFSYNGKSFPIPNESNLETDANKLLPMEPDSCIEVFYIELQNGITLKGLCDFIVDSKASVDRILQKTELEILRR